MVSFLSGGLQIKPQKSHFKGKPTNFYTLVLFLCCGSATADVMSRLSDVISQDKKIASWDDQKMQIFVQVRYKYFKNLINAYHITFLNSRSFHFLKKNIIKFIF